MRFSLSAKRHEQLSVVEQFNPNNKTMKRTLLASLFSVVLALEAQTATVSNQWTTLPDGIAKDGRDLFNVPMDNEKSVFSFGAVGDGTTDDTVAIQAGITYFVTNHGGTLYFPAATYKFSQLTVPSIPGLPSTCVTIRLRGPLLPGQSMYIVSSGGTNTGGAILKSAMVGTAGDSYFKCGSGSTFNNVVIDLENITLLVPPDPIMFGFNCRNAYGLRARGSRVWTGVAPFDITSAPTHTGAGFLTPANNNAAFTHLVDCDVSGIFLGYELSEHADLDYCSAWACVEAGTFPGANHAINVNRFGLYHCQYGFGATGFGTRVNFTQLNIEHASSGWKVSLADVYDPSNLLKGDITWAAVLQGTGPHSVFPVTGGSHLVIREIGTAPAVGGGGGSVGTQFYAGGGSPSITPTNSLAIYYNTNTTTVSYWFNGAWH